MSQPWMRPSATLGLFGVQVPVPVEKTRSLEVIGAGLSRTGTLSVAKAIEMLCDGPVMHGGSQLALREDAYVRDMHAFLRSRHDKPDMLKRLHALTAGFVGITDAPCSLLVPELRELYPSAKVVLVTRDPDRWAKSFSIITKTWEVWWMSVLVWPCPTWRWFPSLLDEFLITQSERLPSYKLYQHPTGEVMKEHSQWIRDLVPPEDLLVMELKQGWEPLCKFLGKPVPDVPFPHVNDSEELQGAMKLLIVFCVVVWAGLLSATAGSAWVVYRLGPRFGF